MTQPTRNLLNQLKPHKYVPAVKTDIAATFAKYRRLAALKAAQAVTGVDDSECNAVDAAGTYKG